MMTITRLNCFTRPSSLYIIATEMVKAKESFYSEPEGELAKTFGAFYTDAQIADFLVWWAIRSAHDTVMT